MRMQVVPPCLPPFERDLINREAAPEEPLQADTGQFYAEPAGPTVFQPGEETREPKEIAGPAHRPIEADSKGTALQILAIPVRVLTPPLRDLF